MKERTGNDPGKEIKIIRMIPTAGQDFFPDGPQKFHIGPVFGTVGFLQVPAQFFGQGGTAAAGADGDGQVASPDGGRHHEGTEVRLVDDVYRESSSLGCDADALVGV